MKEYYQITKEAYSAAMNSLPANGTEGEGKTITIMATYWFVSELAASKEPMTLNEKETPTDFGAVFNNGKWTLKGQFKIK
jgi:hypothetical protein